MRSFLLCRVSMLILAATLSAAASAAEIDALAWMSGCWTRDGQEQHYEECWLHPGGEMMVGLSRTVSANSSSFEFLRVAPYEDGLAYFASPSGRPPTAFPLVEIAPGRAVFLNPDHDFPQRLIYSVDGDTLKADVTALEDGEWKGFQLVLTRAALSH